MSAVPVSGISAGGGRTLMVTALMAAYMQGVNISIPNAALTHMQGGLSMADDEIGWIFTAYIAASLVVIPVAPWLGGRFGRRAVLQISLIIFVLGLVLDTLATTPIEFVLARIVQGAASGPLVPLSAGILFDVLSPARRARIGGALSICILFGISSGPGIGGWLSEYHGWPSIFYFSLPLAGFLFLAVTFLLPEKKAAPKPSFDFFGWAALLIGMTGLQMLLDRGERLEWFDSTEIWAEAIATVWGFYTFFVHVLTAKSHFCNKELFKDRNFALSTIMYFGVGFVLLPTLALTSPMLEELLNYPVDTTGYMTIPRGIGLVGMLMLMDCVPARVDNRALVIGGLALIAYANWLMLSYSPAMDWTPVAITGLLQGTGLGIAIPALTKTAFATLDQKLHLEGGMIFNVSRLYGSMIGIAIVQIFFHNNTQAMHLALAKNLAPYRASAHVAGVIAKPGLAMLNELITGQAAVVAVIGQFKILLIAGLVVSPLALFLRKPRLAGDARIADQTTGRMPVLIGRAALTVIIAASGLTFLSGCKVGPDFKRPAAPAAEQYDQLAQKQPGATGVAEGSQHISLGQKIGGDWWSALGSAKLDQVMRLAIQGNFDLAAADASIAQATEGVASAKGGLYPQVDYGAQIGHGRADAGGLLPAASASFYAIGPLVNYDFDVFGGTKRLVEERGAQADFQKRRYDAAYLTLTGDIANQAILLASVRAQMDAVQILLADDRQNLELVRLARLTGSVAQVEVALAETQLAQDQTLLPPLAQQEVAARHALSVLAGRSPADWAPPDFDLTDFTLPSNLPVSLPSELAHERPDILEAEAELHAASADVGVATADLYPHLTLSGFISETAVGASSPFGPGTALWAFAAEVAGPAFHGGTLRANKRGAVAGYQASFAVYRQTVIRSLGQVADVLQAINHDGEEYSAQEQALDAAGISLRLNRDGYQQGEMSVIEVLDAERAYQQALLGQIRAKTAQYLDTTQLSVALGGNLAGAFERRAGQGRIGQDGSK